MIDVTHQARIVVVCGASGSGKSAWTKQQIEDDARVIVYDSDAEYCELRGFKAVSAPNILAKMLRKASKGRFAYVPKQIGSAHEFDLWAQLAFAWGNCTAVAEELAGVTSPGKAPPGWHTLVSRGRKRGMTIYGVTQRPAESDKTIIGNASLIHCGMLARSNDRAYMARELDCAQYQVDKLKPLEWIERDRNEHELRTGKLEF